MAPDVLNFFSPYERLAAGHENQLTRALLVVLRMSPMSHAAWLRLVAPERQLHELPAAAWSTQVRQIRDAPEREDGAEPVSVFLAPERPLSDDDLVKASDRSQVLDAVINYGGGTDTGSDLVVVVENKIVPDSDAQARELNLVGSGLHLIEGQERMVVLWPELLEAFARILEADLVGGAEALVLRDFLDYVDAHFGSLGPYRTLGSAHGFPFRQERRLRRILSDAVGQEATSSQYGPFVPTPAGNRIGKNAYLALTEDESSVELRLYPADTLTQARAFYADEEAVAGLKALNEQPGWTARPNFHFGHIQKGLCWTRVDRPLDDYVDLWVDEMAAGRVRNVPEPEWPDYWTWLTEQRLVAPEDQVEFDRHFTETERSSATPRPGLSLYHAWPLRTAEALDRDDRFAPAVRDALNAALAACGEPPLVPADA